MDSFGTIKHTEINSNGTARRRYEIEEETPNRTGSKIAGGLLLGSALLAMKNVFFSSSDEEARADESRARTDDVAQLGPSAEKAKPASALKIVYNKDENGESVEPPEFDDGPISSGSSRGLKRGQSDQATATETVPVLNPGIGISKFAPFPTSSKTSSAVVQQSAFQIDEGGAAPSGGGRSATARKSELDASDGGAAIGSKQPEFADDEGDHDDERPGSPPRSEFNNLPFVAAAVFLGDYFVNQTAAFSIGDLLIGATDPDGDELAVENLSVSSGTLVETVDGGWHFTPDAYSVERVTFSYDVTDGEGSVAQTAHIDFSELPGQDFFGTELDDTVIATPGSDYISTLDGDDTVFAREGGDVIETGNGDDRIIAGFGDDQIDAGAGNDIVFAGAGDDVVYAGAGNDYVSGGSGDDHLIGGEGEDTLLGDDGADLLEGGLDADQLFGGTGDDVLFGEEGDDEITGGEGSDFASGGVGDDLLVGGLGDDTLEGGDGADHLMGEDGNDFLVGGADADIVEGGEGDDLLLGDDGDDIIDGGTGQDVVVAGLGDDQVDLGDGNDIAVAMLGDGDDTYQGGDGLDTYDASRATEAVVIDLDQGTVSGSEVGSDQLDSFEHAIGGAGDDVLVAGSEDSVLEGGIGHDVFVFVHASSRGSGGHRRDRIEDFEVGDQIDVSLIDGDAGQSGLQRLTFQYDQAEFSGIGQVLFAYHEDEDTGDFTLIRFNIDEDDETDFEIEIVGRYDFSEQDFIH